MLIMHNAIFFKNILHVFNYPLEYFIKNNWNTLNLFLKKNVFIINSWKDYFLLTDGQTCFQS